MVGEGANEVFEYGFALAAVAWDGRPMTPLVV